MSHGVLGPLGTYVIMKSIERPMARFNLYKRSYYVPRGPTTPKDICHHQMCPLLTHINDSNMLLGVIELLGTYVIIECIERTYETLRWI